MTDSIDMFNRDLSAAGVRRGVGVTAGGVAVGVVSILDSEDLLIEMRVGTAVGEEPMIGPAGTLVGAGVGIFSTAGT